MSIPLPQVNLAGVSVGTTGTISFANTGIGAGGVSANPANIKNAGTVHIFNESGSGLLINFQTSGDGFYLPAGGWTDKAIRAGEAGMKWTVLYNLPSPPVTLLLVTYYGPGEAIPYVPTLGNSPIGIGGTISVASGQTFQLATPFVIFNGSTNINSGTTTNITCTGVGGIPTGATFVWVAIYGTGSAAGTFGTLVPQGATWSVANYPLVGTAAVINHIISGVFAVPLNTTNGQITVGAQNGNWLNITGQIFAYII